VPCISRSSSSPALLIFSAGVFSAAVQSVYFRECLSVFSGNEISIGMILSVWLACTGLGTALAARARAEKTRSFNARTPAALLIIAAIAGMFLVRAGRLPLLQGQTVSPLAMLGILMASEAPVTVINGYVLGRLFSSGQNSRQLYGWENSGGVAGALCVYACILLFVHNSFIVVFAALPLLWLCLGSPWQFAVAAAALVALWALDGPSIQWKYNVPVNRILYGHEGEIVPVVSGKDTTFLQNGVVYKSNLQKPALEQAVHIPMAQRPSEKQALVILDRGHCAELAKYSSLAVTDIETEPKLARKGSLLVSPETFLPAEKFGIVFIGAGVPRSAVENRFYTESFFRHVKSLLADSGIVTFTLAFSENYMSPPEKKMYDALHATLGAVFKNVLVFPGEGYTFMASDASLAKTWKVPVGTEYLSSTIIPGLSEERLAEANKKPSNELINTKDRPLTLFLGLQTWLELFKNSVVLLAVFLFVVCAAVIWFLPKTREGLSVATSGLAIGLYSVSLLLMYQATYGALYSRVSLLLVALTAGFALGALVKKLPFSDSAIGLYCAGSLALLWAIPCPPAFLFYLLHAGMGVLGGGQIVSRQSTGIGPLYAADVFGGAMGMALCSTVLVPLFGILPVAMGICVMKVIVEIVNVRN